MTNYPNPKATINTNKEIIKPAKLNMTKNEIIKKMSKLIEEANKIRKKEYPTNQYGTI